MCFFSGEVGLIVETMGGDETVVGGTVPQRISSCMEALGTLLALPHAVGASMVLADKRRAAAAPTQDLVHAVANILGTFTLKIRSLLIFDRIFHNNADYDTKLVFFFLT